MQSGQIQMAAEAGICFPTILPLFDSPPDQKAMQQWVKIQEPELQTIAKKNYCQY